MLWPCRVAIPDRSVTAKWCAIRAPSIAEQAVPSTVIASADHSLIQEKQSTIFRKEVVDVPGSNPGGSLYVDE